MDAVDFKSIDLAALAQDVTELYRPLAEEKGIELELSAEPPAEIRGQHELMAQAIANVLDNAVKFTPAGGRISVLRRGGPRSHQHRPAEQEREESLQSLPPLSPLSPLAPSARWTSAPSVSRRPA